MGTSDDHDEEDVMEHEPDGMNEAVEGRMRGSLVLALTVATRAAETAAQVVAQRAREAAAATTGRASQLQGRLDAERDVARASVAGVDSEQWWAQATPEQVAAAWQTTQTWRHLDPELAKAGEHITAQVKDRYGVDTADLRQGAGGLRDALAERGAATERVQAEQQTARGGAQREDVLEAAALMREANAADTAHQPTAPAAGAGQQDKGPAYDSAQRRADLATRLKSTGAGPEAAQARVLADTSQGAPATAAVTAAPAPATYRARTVRHGRGAERAKPQSR